MHTCLLKTTLKSYAYLFTKKNLKSYAYLFIKTNITS